MLFGLGIRELALLAVIVLVLFGAPLLRGWLRGAGETFHELRGIGRELGDGHDRE